jgi:hypothetical protein
MLFKTKIFYHFLVRKFPIIFALIYAIFFTFFLKKISNKKNYKKKIIVLNKERFWSDLTALDKSSELLFLYFDKKKLSLITEPFLRTIRKKMTSTFWVDYKDKSFFTEYLNEHSKFIFYFLKFLNIFIKFDSIITPSIHYLQDRAFEKSIGMLNKNLIILHKENTMDMAYLDKAVELMNKLLIKFEPTSLIVVYNDMAKKILVSTKKISSEKVFVLGCPRIDNLIRLNNTNPDKITLCSFKYNFGNLFVNRDASHPLETNNPKLKLYFNNVHLTFIDLASKFKEKEFIIKIKYDDMLWKKLIGDLKLQKEKSIGHKIDNLKIISTEYNMTELLKMSRLVIGINSLSLVEARTLGIPCLVPNFKEVSDYKAGLYFKEFLGSELIEVNNENELSIKIKNYLESDFKEEYSEYNKKFIETYFGYSDKKSASRYIDFLLEN